MPIVGKMDPEKFAKAQAEYRAKMAAIAAKRHQAEAAAEEAALMAHYAEAARMAGSYRPFAPVATKVAAELRQEFAKAEPIVMTGRLPNGQFVSKATYEEARITAMKLAMLGYGE